LLDVRYSRATEDEVESVAESEGDSENGKEKKKVKETWAGQKESLGG
jgi:hypothetical protein